jgi:hypothetical protein
MSPLIFASVTRHGVVLLDLKHNRYLGLGYSDALVLSKHVQGFPRLDQRAEFGVLPEVDHSDDAAILETFMRRGIVTTRHTRRGNIVSNVVSLQGSLVSIGDEITAPAVSPSRHVPAFLYSLICSSACLRSACIRATLLRHCQGMQLQRLQGIRPRRRVSPNQAILLSRKRELLASCIDAREFPGLLRGVSAVGVRRKQRSLDCPFLGPTGSLSFRLQSRKRLRSGADPGDLSIERPPCFDMSR